MSAPPGVEESHRVRVLAPEPGETTLAERLSDLRLTELAGEERPYTIVNFAATADGRATIGGRAGPIGSDADSELLQRLRTQADAVMIGAGTMRAERYGRMVSDPGYRAWRERIGLPHDPLAVIVSDSLELPWDAGLFTDGGGQVLLFTSSDAEPPETATPIRVVRHEDGVNVIDAVRYLRQERGIRALLCEGGPRLNAEMWAARVADELFLTTAPKLAGGEGPSILEGQLADVEQLELVWLLESDGELYARYRYAQAR
jgi:riboflavin biosynthesis pyrimidine reductase